MMLSDFQNLRGLAACLAGRFPDGLDWDTVVELANQTMTITALASAVRETEGTPRIPEDVRHYLAVIHASNTQRNAMLRVQLEQAVACLNSVGIEPAVTKGAAVLLTPGAFDSGGRLLNDLDILVRPHVMQQAVGALRDIGYDIWANGGVGTWPGDRNAHLPTVLGRRADAGSIDLQCRPKGPASFNDIEWLYTHSTRIALGESHLYVPSAFAQTVYLLLHDQFQDGDYWRGLIDLRHIFDILRIAGPADDVDWEKIRSMFTAGYERRAVDTQILTAHALFGTPDISAMTFGMVAPLQLRRRRLQAKHRRLQYPLTIATLLSEIGHYAAWDRFGGGPIASPRQKLKHAAREMRRIFRAKPLGKI